MCSHKAVNEVEQELAKPENKNVCASVNTATGEVRSIIAPKPYWQTTNATPSSSELQRQIDALVAQLPKLKGGARSKADHRIRLLQREVRRALDLEAAERRHQERRAERQRQQVGADSPFARQTLAEQVASVVAGVAALTSKQVKNKLTWNTLLRDLDARVPKAGPPNRSAVCCEGRYLCAKCQARKAATVA